MMKIACVPEFDSREFPIKPWCCRLPWVIITRVRSEAMFTRYPPKFCRRHHLGRSYAARISGKKKGPLQSAAPQAYS